MSTEQERANHGLASLLRAWIGWVFLGWARFVQDAIEHLSEALDHLHGCLW